MAKPAVRVGEERDIGGRTGRQALHQHEVDADTQRGMLPGESDRLGERPPVHHQAGVGQNPIAVRADDAGVDSGRHAEVVG